MLIRRQYHIPNRIFLLITRIEDEKKIGKIFDYLRIPIYYQCRGKGTADSEFLNICGLQGTGRLITISVLSKPLIKEIFSIMSRGLFLERKGRGIAVAIPVTGMQDMVQKILENRDSYKLSKQEGEFCEMVHNKTAYSMIFVAANYGYSEEIIQTARKAGAKGGTVIKGRRQGSESVMRFLGVTSQEEQEFTIIIVPQNQRTEVMVEISRSCGLKTPAHGIVLSIPVEEILGMEE